VRIAISNIAWRVDEEPAVRELLVRLGVRGVEVAPSKVGPAPDAIGADAARRYREAWEQRGIGIVAMQALLFGRPELAIFAGEAPRAALRRYLAAVIELGGRLGARALVFGSPRNRRIEGLPRAEVERIAIPFFRELGRVADGHDTCLVVEPNPPSYGADWITDARSAVELVEAVDHPGFGLHLDAGGLHLAGEGPAEIARGGAWIRHFHASQPELAPLAPGGAVPHADYAAALRALRYPRWVSIEMREVAGAPSALPAVETAVRHAQDVYGPDAD
jgi:sugar phosphate isomerase/epimerase